VAFVVAFHLGVPWATGGYLGVSVFFTLSGFLITSLLLSEHERTGRIGIRAFYLRRARRLLPAALLCIGGITALLVTGVLPAGTGARAEVFSALFEAANWHALLAGESYADLFVAPSALTHFWSLAIEEQFYVVWPIAFAALGGWAARRRGKATLSVALVAMFVVFAFAAPVTAWLWSADAVYLASWCRFAEILAGAALASLLSGRTLPRSAGALAPVCLVAIVGLCVITPSGTGWPYAGYLPLFALVSVGLIAGLQVDGAGRSLLEVRPLVKLGVISYGVYLFHWPVIVVLDEQRTGWRGISLGALRIAVTLAVSIFVYWIVEHPIRVRTLLVRQSRFAIATATGLAAVAVSVAVLVPEAQQRNRNRPALLVATAPAGTAGGDMAPSPSPTAGPSTLPPRPRPTNVAVFGDSVPAWLLQDAAPTYARTDFVIINVAHEGCDGAPGEPLARGARGEPLERRRECLAWFDEYPFFVENPAQPVDIALLMLGESPVLSHLIDGRWVHPCEDMTWYTTDIAARIDYLTPRVSRVVLALPSWLGNRSSYYFPADHDLRFGCVRDRLLETAVAHGATTIDLATLLCPAGADGDCPDLRERDGMHVDPEDAPMVLNWVLDQLAPPTPTSAS